MARKKIKHGVRWWKKKAWEAFSQYIRLRDCIGATGGTDYGRCITCERPYERKQLQGGHFIPGHGNSVYFDERNVHAQCYSCNMYKGGNVLIYRDKMLEMYGQDVIDELRRLDKQTRKFTVDELKELREHYNELSDRLIDGVSLEQLEEPGE